MLGKKTAKGEQHSGEETRPMAGGEAGWYGLSKGAWGSYDVGKQMRKLIHWREHCPKEEERRYEGTFGIINLSPFKVIRMAKVNAYWVCNNI